MIGRFAAWYSNAWYLTSSKWANQIATGLLAIYIWITLAMYWLHPASRRKGADCVCRIGAAPRHRPSPFHLDAFATAADGARLHAGRRHTEQSSQSGKLHPEPVG